MIKTIRSFFSQRFRRWVVKRIPAQSSVTLNQSRIFIVPSQQGVFLLLVCGLILLLAVNFESSLNYALCFWLMAMLWVSVHLTYRNLSGLTITAASHSLTPSGVDALFEVTLSSSKPFNRGELELISPSWGSRSVMVDQTSQIVELPVFSVKRGPLVLPRFRIETRYPFGLVVAWSYVQPQANAWVYPSSVDAPRTAGAFDEDADEAHSHSLMNGSDDFYGLRPYETGESFKRLHWPSFAKDQLHIVERRDQAASDCHIHWDDFIGLTTEQRLSAIAALAEQLDARGAAYSVSLPNVTLALNSGAAHLNAVRRQLAGYGFE